MIYWFAYFLMKIFIFFCCPCKFIGRENIPTQGAFIVASNHVSNLDPFLVGSGFSRRLSYLAKEELFKGKVRSFFLYKVGAFPIKRGASDLGAIKEVFRRLKLGEPILLFPEGTRTLDASKRKIQAGVGLIALKSQLPVVPVFIDGSEKVLPPGAKRLIRHNVTIRFGKPLKFSREKTVSASNISQKIMQNILMLKQ